MTMTFRVYGEPVGKGRPRFARRGGRVVTYTPDKTAEYEREVCDAFRAAAGYVWKKLEGPVQLQVTAYYGIPASAGKRKQQAMLDGAIPPTKKPDADNVVKIICDALNDVAWADDAQITVLHFEKRYGAIPYAEVTISGDE